MDGYKMKKLIALFLMATSLTINAKEISYDFIDTSYYDWDQESKTSIEKWDGYFTTLNKSLYENI